MNLRSSITLTATTVVLVLGLVACGEQADQAPDETAAATADGSPHATTSDAEVSIEGVAFAEQEITVPAGTTVTWVNNDSVGHTVTHGEDGQPASDAMFDEDIGVGEEVSFTFDEPGTYPVTCTIHPQMNMTVVVEG